MMNTSTEMKVKMKASEVVEVCFSRAYSIILCSCLLD